jgi:glutamate-1-semialdehyde 2,1-aminomutase
MARNLAKSRELYDRCRQSLAGGTSSTWKPGYPFPLFWERGEGSRLYDVDGNEYLDYTLSAGPTILGHNPAAVIEAVGAQLERGFLFPGSHMGELELSELLCQIIPCAALVHYANSGSEANHIAFRLARAYTGREKVIKFEGLYHGWFDDMFHSITPALEQAGPEEAPNTIPQTHGQAANAAQNVIVVPWNNLGAFVQAVARHRDQVAAVITVPVWYARTVEPKDGYLEGLRDICTQNGIVLIFDEVISGFRTALGGAQAYYGVTPDLATYAKGIAAGLALGCLAGRKEIMSMMSRGEVMHPGTYNGNPIVIAGAVAAMRELIKDDTAIYARLFDMSERLMVGCRESATRWGVPVSIQGLGPGFSILFTDHGHLWDYRDLVRYHNAKMASKFTLALADRGVLCSAATWFISTAHTDKDIDLTLAAVDEAMKEIKD